MTGTIMLSFRLTENHWRQFYEIHYAADHRLKLWSIFGGAFILIGAMGIGGLFNRYIALFVLINGFYGVLARHIFLFRSIAAARKHSLFEKNVTAEFSSAGITVTSDGLASQRPWASFTGYRTAAPGIMFYMAPQAFFFVPAAAYSAEEAEVMVGLANGAGLRNLAG